MIETSPAQRGRVVVRRILVALVVPFTLVALVWLGRHATSVAAPTSSSTTASTASTAMVADARVVDVAVEASASAPRPAIELLADGGVIVDVNLATEDELRRLPGVGPTRAKAILDLRKRLGRIKSIEDLSRIKGFGRATLRRLRPFVRVSS